MANKFCIKTWTLTLSSDATVYPEEPLQQSWGINFDSIKESIFSTVDFKTEIYRKMTEQEFDELVSKIKKDYFSSTEVWVLKG